MNSRSVFLYDSTLSGMHYLVWGMSYLVGYLGFPGGSDGKETACNVGDLCLIPGLGRSPGEGNQVSWPGESHGWRNPVGSSPWSCKESDTTEWLTHKVFGSRLVMSDALQPRGL